LAGSSFWSDARPTTPNRDRCRRRSWPSRTPSACRRPCFAELGSTPRNRTIAQAFRSRHRSGTRAA
jgi:hypothetical protein